MIVKTFFLFLTANLLLLQIIAQSPKTTFEGDLPRRAHLGFQTRPADNRNIYDSKQLAVQSVEANSPAANAGLKKGDAITTINGQKISSAIQARETLENLPGEVKVTLDILRNQNSLVLSFTPKKEPLEGLKKVHTTYGVLLTDNKIKLRTLFTKPLNKKGPFPTILLSDWTSCGSVEVPYSINRGWINLVRGVVEDMGMAVLRIDKPGVGDSLGFCSELDFDQTVAYQKKALKQLKSHPDVDSKKIFIFGESVGSFMAPLVAQDENVAGIFVYGGGARTWFERMVEFERKQRELSGKPLDEIDIEMKQIIAFFHYYLVEALPLNEIFARKPAFRAVWENYVSHNSSTKHYGRPISFHQQAQRHNFAKAWIDTKAPALVLIGNYDQFESIDGARSLVNAINRARPDDGKLIIYPNMNHQLELYPTREAALKGRKEKVIGAHLVLNDINNWLKQILKKTN